jgi:MoaA/NifB/PqqE/SkfB family radical SAM enzyme
MALQRLTFHITDRCQLNCDHCLRDPDATAKDLDLPLIISVLDQARALFDTKHVGLTGGEPALHPKFFEIVDAIVDRGYTWHVVSNGERFERTLQKLSERPVRLAQMKLLNFSLDGANRETHDAIREQGSFRNVLQAVSLCRAREIPFLLQITLNARNVEQIEEMALLASQLGAERLAYNFTQPTGTFLDRSLHLPPSEWKRALDRINRVRTTFKIAVVHSEIAPHDEPFHMCEMWRQEHLHVDPSGQLNLCCQHAGVPARGELSDVAGDLHHMSLAQAHLRFTEIVNRTVEARLELLASGIRLDEWDRNFSCNWCLKRFGKPHWVDGGTDGPEAARARWRGGWAPGYKPSHAREGVVRLPVVGADGARGE